MKELLFWTLVTTIILLFKNWHTVFDWLNLLTKRISTDLEKSQDYLVKNELAELIAQVQRKDKASEARIRMVEIINYLKAHPQLTLASAGYPKSLEHLKCESENLFRKYKKQEALRSLSENKVQLLHQRI